MAVGVVSDVFRIGQPRLLALGEQLHRRREPAGDEDAGEIERHHQPQRPAPRRRLEAFEVADLALAEDEHASGLQVLVEAREREAGFLDVGAGDEAIGPGAAGQQLDDEPERFGPAAQQAADGYTRKLRHLSRSSFERSTFDANVERRTSRFRFDERQLTVRAPVEDADARRLGIAEDEHAFAVRVDLAGRLADRHRLSLPAATRGRSAASAAGPRRRAGPPA